MAAAAQLGCEIYKACSGAESSGDCALPSGVTRVTRQGITIEKLAFTTWAYQRETRARAERPAGRRACLWWMPSSPPTTRRPHPPADLLGTRASGSTRRRWDECHAVRASP